MNIALRGMEHYKISDLASMLFSILPWRFWFIPFWLGVKNSHGACTGIKIPDMEKWGHFLSSPTPLHSAISIYRRRLEHALRFDTLKLKITFTMKRHLHLTYDGPRQWTRQPRINNLDWTGLNINFSCSYKGLQSYRLPHRFILLSMPLELNKAMSQ